MRGWYQKDYNEGPTAHKVGEMESERERERERESPVPNG